MNNVTVNAFRNWSEFLSDILPVVSPDSRAPHGRYLFRGQRDAEWPLVSSFDRWFSSRVKNGLATENSRSDISDNLLAQFRIRAIRLDAHYETLGNDELRALAQHSGIPTRLLDWTESPYIAACFAFSGAMARSQSTGDVAVWCIDRQHACWKGHRGMSVISLPASNNPRMRNQVGHFTLNATPFENLEDAVIASGAKEAIRQFTIPARDAADAVHQLTYMGIDLASVFPDLDGAAQAVMMLASL